MSPGQAYEDFLEVQRERTATAELREEHRLILRVVDVLERTVDYYPDSITQQTVDDCIVFFRLFADACHHGKEEAHLFPALEEAGLPRDDGPVAVMLEEHRLARGLVQRMALAATGVRDGEPAQWREVQGAAREYAALIRAHIEKEDGVLFEMADARVEPVACERLCEAYELVCRQRFEGLSVEHLRKLADRLTAAVD